METSNKDKNKICVLIVAAEASSSLYAERLLQHWKLTNQNIQSFGIGNKKMVDMGFEAIGYAEDLAVVGVQEVITHFSKIFSVFRALVKMAQKRRPDLVLLMDYPDFNFRLGRKLKKEGFKIVYYISPQVWAWRKGRVHFIKKYFDKMLVLFPFEVDFYNKYQIDSEFVGHPLLDEIKPELFEKDFSNNLRAKYGIPTDKFVLGLMPGSRNSELKHHLKTQVEVAEEIFQRNRNVIVALLVAPTLSTEQVKKYLPDNLRVPIIMIKRDPFEMVRMCDFVLTASGTATLTVGLMETPMAIMYKMSSLTVGLAKLIMKKPKFFGMVNLILDEMVSKEFFQEQANTKDLSEHIIKYIESPESRENQISKLKNLKLKLGRGGATHRVSEIILKDL